MFLAIFMGFSHFVDHQRTDGNNGKTIHVTTVHYVFRCQGNVSKQTNPFQVDDLITNKYVALLEASRKILNTVSKFVSLQM
jgi:hypothetical protein